MPRGKGSQFERDICKKLSLWISRGERKDLFWRSAMSGGRSLPTCAGDISAVHPDGHVLTDKFVIECKHHKASIFLPILFPRGKKPLIRGWWDKLKAEADKFGRRPMLIIRENNSPVMVCMTGELTPELDVKWTVFKGFDTGYAFASSGLWVGLLDELLDDEGFREWVTRK